MVKVGITISAGEYPFFRELINATKEKHPNDNFFDTFDENLKSEYARNFYEAYNQAFSSLDTASWKELLKKAVAHFCDSREGDRKSVV